MKKSEDTVFSSSGESTDDMLEAIGVTSGTPDDDSAITNEKKRERRRLMYVTAGAATTVALLVGAIFLVPTVKGPSKSSPQSTSSSDTVQHKTISALPSGDPNASQNFARTNPIPFDHEDWQIAGYKNQASDDESTKKLLNTIQASIQDGRLDNGTLSLSASTLPSEEAGFTSDQNKVTLEDGTINPMFSYWTKENFETEVGTAVERLLNPSFGQWENYQYPEYKANSEFDISTISDLFTNNWLESNTGKPYSEYVPVMADWNSDNYGGTYNLTDVAKWFGKVQSSTTEFHYNSETQQYTATYTANVKYVAWTKDQKTVERNATLTLNLVPAASQQHNNGSSHRVLIDSATLKVDN